MTTKITMYQLEKLHSFSMIPTTYKDKSMKDSWHTERELNVDTQDSIKLV